MDMVYFERPIFVLLPIVLLAWKLFYFFIKKKKELSPFIDTILVSIGVVGHAAAITIILLGGGTLSDALVLVLLSCALSLILSPKETTISKEGKK